ncbi:hypothetical protein C0J52_10390 [Blattella germanica]|nr:hypothetical protein C0J52_10390 [Blattella germanica]
MGTSCETGCGPNMYGSKCDRRCSKTKRGCEGIKLCRPNLACTCAAGLMGDFCDISKFIYSLGTEIVKKHVVIVRMIYPVIHIQDHVLLVVKQVFIFHTAGKEHDNPNNSRYEASTHEITSSAIAFNITGLKPATKYDTCVVLINDDGGSYQGADIATAVFRTSCEGKLLIIEINIKQRDILIYKSERRKSRAR